MVDDALRRQLPPGLAMAWGVMPSPGKRGPKPAFSVARIVDTALALADEEGFAELSMPKIAGRLGISANALYRYVSSKDELLVLLSEAAVGVPPSSITGHDGWRPGATAWVHALLDRYRRHPWLLDMPVRGAPMTPNLLRWLEVLLAAMSGTGLRNQDLVGCAVLLDGYARSTATLERNLRETTTPPVQSAAIAEFLGPLLQERGFPHVAAAMSAGDYTDDDLTETNLDDIDFGLTRILDGIDILITTGSARGFPSG
jgi:AcrR family transcriptional regulator